MAGIDPDADPDKNLADINIFDLTDHTNQSMFQLVERLDIDYHFRVYLICSFSAFSASEHE